MNTSFSLASALTLEELAELYTRCFSGYTYPVKVEPAALARRIRTEQIDLAHSPLICVGGELGGLALLGVRGAETNCAGFGLTAPHRGQGLAHMLLADHLRLARAAGGRRISLMVLIDNGGAIRTYRRAGMQIQRQLLWLEWQAPKRWCGEDSGVVAESPRALLDQLAALPRVVPFWQRDLPTLRALDGVEGWRLGELPIAPQGHIAGSKLHQLAVAPVAIDDKDASKAALYQGLEQVANEAVVGLGRYRHGAAERKMVGRRSERQSWCHERQDGRPHADRRFMGHGLGSQAVGADWQMRTVLLGSARGQHNQGSASNLAGFGTGDLA